MLEDYVELIDDLLQSQGKARPTDIARRLGVSHATAIKSIARLKREGLATSKLYRGVFLTLAGQGVAARVRARHRLVVDLLVAVGVPRHVPNSTLKVSSITSRTTRWPPSPASSITAAAVAARTRPTPTDAVAGGGIR